jgi:NADP-dependent 3-hydroxy acid dehydrogenase YdfG
MDCMFNNAGIAVGGGFGELSHAQHAAQVQINCMGAPPPCRARRPWHLFPPRSLRARWHLHV